MKRIIIATLLVLSSITGYAQEDSTFLSAHYIAHFKTFAEAIHERTEEQVLDIGENSSCFYGRWYRRRREIIDSIAAAGGNFDDMLAKISEYPTPYLSYIIYDNYPSVGKRTVTHTIIKHFHYEEDIDDIQWVLLDRDTTILDYPCQTATCEYRNHRWTVCYAPEIPVSLGPWKLRGLPGLILYAADDTGIFSFECIELRNEAKPVAVPKLSKSIKCTREEIKEMERVSCRNPDDLVRRLGFTPGKAWDANGKPLVYKERTAIFID